MLHVHRREAKADVLIITYIGICVPIACNLHPAPVYHNESSNFNIFLREASLRHTAQSRYPLSRDMLHVAIFLFFEYFG
jgi:hypothetical protein